MRRKTSLFAVGCVIASAFVVAQGVLGGAPAGAADPVLTQCVTNIAPTTVLNATTKRLVHGKPQIATLPSSVPADASAVVLQVRTSGNKAGAVTFAPSATPTAKSPGINVELSAWNSGTVVVNSPTTKLSVLFTAIGSTTATAGATVVAVGYISNQPCYHQLNATTGAAVSTTTGAGLTSPGALSTTGPIPFTLHGDQLLPANAGAALVHVKVSAGAVATSLVIHPADDPTASVASYRVSAKDTLEVAAVLPPSTDSEYTVTASGAGTNLALTPIGWFDDANAYAQSSAVVLDNKVGIGSTKLHLGSGTKVTLPIPTDIPNPAGYVLSLVVNPLATSAVAIWPSSSTKPTYPTGSYVKARMAYQQVFLAPGTAKAVTINVTSGSVDINATITGWVPFPPAQNQPVAGVTHVPDDTQVTAVSAPEADGSVTATYTGPDQLDEGDVVAMGVTDDTPDGLLGVVTSNDTAAAVTTQGVRVASATRTRTSSTSAESAAEATPDAQTVTLRPATLDEALPSADLDSSVLEVDSGTPPPDTSPDLPPDTPPPPSDDPVDPPTTGSIAPRALKPAAMSSNATSVGGGFGGSSGFSCSGGAGISIAHSLQLYSNLHLTAGWNPWDGVHADFGYSGGLKGSVSLTVGANAKCSFSKNVPGPSLPTFTFTVGPVPVVVRPVLSMDVSASIQAAATAFKASAGIDIGLDTGVKYEHGWSSYFTPHAKFPVSVDSKTNLSGTGKVEVKPRIDLKIYGVAGPFAELGAFATGTVQNKDPWWTAEAGIVADVGLALKVWKVSASIDIGERVVSQFHAGNATSAYPGATITTTSLPGGQVGVAYSGSLSASGGHGGNQWSRIGPLPNGLTLNANGTITGTPTAVQATGFYVRAIDSAGYRSTADKYLTISIGNAPPPPPQPDYCPNGDYSGNAYDGTCGTPPPPGGSVTLSWGARASSSICGGDTSCTYLTISWSGFSTGNHTITPYFDGQGNWCGGASCSNSLVRSGSSGSLTGYWAVGYCRQSHSISATVDGVGSNALSTTSHGC